MVLNLPAGFFRLLERIYFTGKIFENNLIIFESKKINFFEKFLIIGSFIKLNYTTVYIF
jgi:hypothetical protein